MMRRVIAVILFIPLLTGSLRPQEQGVQTRIELDDEMGERFVAYDNSWALVVGINDYEDTRFTALNYAADDANAIARLLVELGFPNTNIRTLTGKECTLGRIKDEFVSLSQTIGHNDRLLVYWAGHGVTQSLPRGGEIGYLVPSNGKQDALYSTCLSMDEIRRLCDLIAAKHILFLVDACYGGLSAYLTRGAGEMANQYLRQLTTAEAIQIITAGTKDEQVVESSTWGHSAFAKALLDGFETKMVDRDNNGIVTSDELYSYLAPKVFELAQSEGPAHRPVFANLKPSDGQFVFLVSVPEFNLTILGQPLNNKILIGGRVVSEKKDTVILRLKRGTYLVEIDAPGYERYSATVAISEDRSLTPKMYSWTEAAQRRLLELEGPVRQTRIGLSAGLSLPGDDFGDFVRRSGALELAVHFEQEISDVISMTLGIGRVKWRTHNKAYGDYHPTFTPEFNFENNASATVAEIGARIRWDFDAVRLFGFVSVGFHFLNYQIKDEVNAVDLRKTDTNLGYGFGIGSSLNLTEGLDVEITVRPVVGQGLHLMHTEGSGDFVYGANNVRLSYIDMRLGLSYTLTNLLSGN